MQILVTGGMGFIGTNFIRYWKNKYPQDLILNLDSLTYAANTSNLEDLEGDSHYKFIKGDIRDADIVKKAMDGVELVVHFAAESHVDRSIDNPTKFLETNVLGTYTLLSEAKNSKTLKRFHHISTDEVYGSVNRHDPKDTFSESRPYDPSSPYSASKASSDHLVNTFHKTFGLPISISNCSNNYGPYQHPEKFIPRAVTSLIKGEKIKIYGTGENIRDWLYVEDHCRAIDLIINQGKPGCNYCLGGNFQDVTNLEIVKKLCELMKLDFDKSVEFVADRPGHDDYRISREKIKSELGWEPTYSFDTGIAATTNWYKNHPTWWQETKKEAEQFYLKTSPKKTK